MVSVGEKSVSVFEQFLITPPHPIRTLSGCIGVWILARLSTSFCTIHPDATGETIVKRAGDSIKQKILTIFLIISVFIRRSSFSKWSWADFIP